MALNFPDPASQTPVNEFSPTSTPASTDNGVTYTWTGNKWKAAGSGGAGGDYLPISGGELTGDLTVPSLNGGQLAGFRNQIINGDFCVWQRDTSFTIATSGTDFTADRMLVFSTSGSITATRSDPLEPFSYSIRIAKGSGDTGWIGQLIELNRMGHNSQFKLGSTWTVSIYSTADLSGLSPNVSFRDKSFPNPAGSPTCTVTAFTQVETNRYAAQVTIDVNTATALNTAQGLLVLVPLNTGATVNYSGFQLEPGPVATPFEHRPIGTELALCQRYYQKVGETLFQKIVTVVGSGTGCFGTLLLPVPLRVQPTFASTNVVSAVRNVGVSTGNFTNQNWIGSLFGFDINQSLGLSAHQSDILQVSNANGGVGGFTFDAEL